MAKILVIEDEADLQEVLRYNLAQAGHEVTVVGRGDVGVRTAKQLKPDLVLLDLMLPGLSGTEVCTALKRDAATETIPILMVTAKGEEIDRVLGFELGAEDYVVKPFSVRELLLRVQAVLRRANSTRDVPAAPVVETERLRIDREAHRAFVDGKEIELTALEFKLLVTFLERRERVQTRTKLLDDVWGVTADVTTRTVDTHVKRLREKLGPVGDHIETVRGVGYRFSEVAGPGDGAEP
jgi:two-component system phosphate regulon response regulator PhoB